MTIFHVSFIRQLSEDVPVLEDKEIAITSRSLIAQVAEEFAPHMTDGVELQMGGFLEKDDNGDNYTVEGHFTFPQEEISHGDDDVWEKRYSLLKNFTSFLQEAYDEGVAGLFDVISMQIGRSAFPATEVVTKARAELLVKGKDLLSLSAEEVFDRTKRQEGEVALIASGEFDYDGIHSNSTAYAVGKVNADGTFEPILSHMRLGEATTLFDKTVAFEKARSYAAG